MRTTEPRPSAPRPDAAAFRRTLTRAVLLPLVLTAALAGLFLWQISRLLDATRWVEHTDEVISQADDTLKLLVDLETGVRGYLVTNRRDYLEPYERAAPRVGPALDELTRLVSDNPPQVARVEEIRRLHGEWMGYAREVVELKDSGGDYQSRVGRGVGKVRMDAMRARFDDFVETEERLRDERSQGTRRAARLAVGTGGAAALLLGVILAFSVGRQLVSVSSAYGGALDSEQEQRRRLGTTLQSIGDAVIVTDAGGRVTLMNPVAESVTGWKTGDARGRPLPEVFRIVNEETRAEVENPVKEVLRADAVVGLANHTLLIAKGGAESEGRGRGATFSVRLPVLAPEGNAGAAAARGPGGDAPSIERTPKLDGVRVLLVDDDRDTLEMLDAVLLRCEAEVVTAASAAEALSEIERRRPDVLVSDIGMPEADGYELIKSVRASEAERGGAAIPALALTAYAKAEDRVRALAAGYQAHLAKPVEPAEFALVVASLAGRGQK